jgi:hypothetical protein
VWIHVDTSAKRRRAISFFPHFQVYIWVTEKERCWETRGLTKSDQMRIAPDAFESAERDFTAYLNNWEMVHALNQ